MEFIKKPTYRTAFYLAVYMAQYEAVKILLQVKEIDINHQDKSKISVLMF